MRLHYILSKAGELECYVNGLYVGTAAFGSVAEAQRYAAGSLESRGAALDWLPLPDGGLHTRPIEVES